MKFRLCGANNKNPFLARTFGGLRVMHFQKKTSSWEKLHRRNYIPLGGELISELEAVKRRCPCFKRVHSVSFELQHFCPGSDNTGCYGFVMVCFSRWVEPDSFSWTCTKKRRNSLRGTLHLWVSVESLLQGRRSTCHQRHSMQSCWRATKAEQLRATKSILPKSTKYVWGKDLLSFNIFPLIIQLPIPSVYASNL